MATRLIAKEFLVKLFIFSIFLCLIPPLVFFNQTFLSPSYLGRILLMILFMIMLGDIFLGRFKSQNIFKSKSSLFVFMLFVVSSLSVFPVLNFASFLKYYEKFVVGTSIYFMVFWMKHLNKNIFNILFKVFYWGFLVRLFMELGLILFPDFVDGIGSLILNPLLFRSIKANLVRQRTYVDFIQEAFVPILLFGLVKKNSSFIQKAKQGFLIMVAGAISFLSNWRGRVLVFLFSVFSFLATHVFTNFNKKYLLRLVGLFLGLFIFINFLDNMSVSRVGFSVRDRLMSTDEAEDVSTVEWRLNAFNASIGMGSSGFFGVGLGNYYEWLGEKKRYPSFIREFRELADAASSHGPHNIFFQYLAEMGYVGLIVFIALLVGFAIEDVRGFGKNKYSQDHKAIALSFWALISVVQFYPATSLSFYVSFYLLRAMLVI
jgi:hypothetical protein